MCSTARLIVEVDGGQHQERATADDQRMKWLEREGYCVLRVWNNDVLRNMAGVLTTVLAELDGAVE